MSSTSTSSIERFFISSSAVSTVVGAAAAAAGGGTSGDNLAAAAAAADAAEGILLFHRQEARAPWAIQHQSRICAPADAISPCPYLSTCLALLECSGGGRSR